MSMGRNSKLGVILLSALTTVRSERGSSSSACKSVPGSAGWPSPEQWSQLNQDLGGQLLSPLPPAIACDPSQPSSYNQTQCNFVGAHWFNETFFTGDPVSVHYPNWQNDACLPTAVYNVSTNCYVTPFPTYVVNATSAEDVATAVSFAAANGVRVSIKGTGHDFLGRNTAPGLAIWTHNLRGIEVVSSFQPTGCNNCQGVPAVTVAAGHINCEVYAETQKYGVIPVLGYGPGVGVGGYLTGGGHSPISGKYGLAVDNVLEMQLVTPNGSIVVANDYQYQDLYWAMKGGAGSTFGVLISATLKTIPVFPVSKIGLQFTSTSDEASQNNNSNWYSGLAYFNSQIPKLTDNDIYGYYNVGPLSSYNLTNGSVPMSFAFDGWALDKSKKTTDRLLSSVKKKLGSLTGVASSISVVQKTTVYDILQPCGRWEAGTAAGYNSIIGSRLWDKVAVTNQQSFISTIRSLNPPAYGGLMISGPGVRDLSKLNTTSVTPAWRSTYLHVTVYTRFAYRNQTQQQQVSNDLTYYQTAALRNHAPNMGCYNNEADVNEPNYQQAFWGSNYARLLQIKQKYDPTGVFWCSVCVGAENWQLNTTTGELCPAP